jgi:hypothetical protein
MRSKQPFNFSPGYHQAFANAQCPNFAAADSIIGQIPANAEHLPQLWDRIRQSFHKFSDTDK